MGWNTHRGGLPNPLVNIKYFAPSPPWKVTAPAPQTGQIALSTARNLHKNGAPTFRVGRLRFARRLRRGAHARGGSDVCRFRAAERAVGPRPPMEGWGQNAYLVK
eukprot:13387401-Alexandrium_andersonii.AAC.1